MRWLAPAHAIGWRLAMVIVLNAFALTLPLTAVDLYVVRHTYTSATASCMCMCMWHQHTRPHCMLAAPRVVPVCASSAATIHRCAASGSREALPHPNPNPNPNPNPTLAPTLTRCAASASRG